MRLNQLRGTRDNLLAFPPFLSSRKPVPPLAIKPPYGLGYGKKSAVVPRGVSTSNMTQNTRGTTASTYGVYDELVRVHDQLVSLWLIEAKSPLVAYYRDLRCDEGQA